MVSPNKGMHVQNQFSIQTTFGPVFVVQRRRNETVKGLPPSVHCLSSSNGGSWFLPCFQLSSELLFSMCNWKILDPFLFAQALARFGSITVESDSFLGSPKKVMILAWIPQVSLHLEALA